MVSDELKIVLEDVKEKFDTVIEAFNMVRATPEPHKEENQKEHGELKNEIILLRKDVNNHRDSTELYAGGKRINYSPTKNPSTKAANSRNPCSYQIDLGFPTSANFKT